jgi:polyribonucleotide nucleotidyltransferase
MPNQETLKPKTITINLGSQSIVLETGKIAKQANGSVFLHCGETSILATACLAPEAGEETDFLGLRVDYQEKFSAAGKTLGGFIKREGKPSVHEILVSRFIDRTLRPLFHEGIFNEIQILSFVYSYDGVNNPDILGINAASAALVISDIPFDKPVGAVRVGKIDGKLVLNPSKEQQKTSILDLVLGGTENAILMIEGCCDFLTEKEVLEAIDFGHKAIQEFCKGLKEWQKEVGKEKRNEIIYHVPEEMIKAVEKLATKGLLEALQIADKKKREKAFAEIKTHLEEELLNKEETTYLKKDLNIAFSNLSSNLMRQMILKKNIRIDGRKLTDIRPISIEPGFLTRTHGSCLFTRGETQTIAVCTLGGETMAQRFENLHEEGSERFYLQYFFPPFSVGEVGRMAAPGRREIGHGKLAEHAISMALPKATEFPYVMRVESNITESNGSSSMASVCGGCLALMDAGVPIKKPVSGIAMGLILEKDEYRILSDILGAEDALGDMDFKICGDETGITAFQMDIKVEGITLEIMEKALSQAKEGRIHILKKMLEALPAHKLELSKFAPRIEVLKIKPSKIGALIGPGGKNIKEIIEKSKVDVDIQDDGSVQIVSPDGESIEKAKEMIRALTEEAEIGKVYHGVITSIKPFGLFVKLVGEQEGLCHISEISNTKIDNLEKIFKEGDKLDVKVLDINDRGQIRLSHKVLLPK